MDKSYVSIEQNVCGICGKVFEPGGIILDKRLRPVFDHKTVTGYGTCPECREQALTHVALVEVTNQHEGDTLKPEEANRTGRIVWVRREVFAKIFNVATPTSVAFVDHEVVDYLEKLQRGSKPEASDEKQNP